MSYSTDPSRGFGISEDFAPSLEDELEEAADLLSHQEPEVPDPPAPPEDFTNPLLIDPAD